MCLLSVVFQQIPDCPLLLFANRDESPNRPAGAPRLFPAKEGKAAWFGPVDLQSGGTWLGINEYEMIVAVTNRHKAVVGPNLRSRGLLCRELLECRSVDAALDQVTRQLHDFDYDGCNLVLLSRDQCSLAELADEVTISDIPSGFHVITNGVMDDPQDGRLLRVRTELIKLNQHAQSLEQWIDNGRLVCRQHASDGLPAICLHDEDFQGRPRETVSSTIIALATDPNRQIYRYAAGPPCQTAFEDYSQSAHQLSGLAE